MKGVGRRHQIDFVAHFVDMNFAVVDQQLRHSHKLSQFQCHKRSEIGLLVAPILDLHCPTLKRHNETRLELILRSVEFQTRHGAVEQQTELVDETRKELCG